MKRLTKRLKRKMTKDKLGKAYDRNYEKMMRARPGSKNHKYWVKRERKLSHQLIMLNVYPKDPCPLYKHSRVSCGNCTGWYARKVVKIKKSFYKRYMRTVVGKGEKCKMK